MYDVKPTETDKRTFSFAFELETDLLPPLQKVNIFLIYPFVKEISRVYLDLNFFFEKKKNLIGYVMQCQTCNLNI